MKQFEFSDHYPAEIDYVCPPGDATCYTGILYRYSAKKDAVCAKDTKLAIKREGFIKSNQDNLVLLCQGGGLSSFLTIESTRHSLDQLKKNAPFARKKFNGIHKIEIDETDGVVKNTPSKNSKNHYTWWSTRDINYLDRAVFIEEF